MPIPSIVAPSATRKPAEVLHVRLAGGVAQDGVAGGGDGGHERVLGARHAGLVEEDVGAAEPRGGERDAVVERVRGAEALEREEMRVEAAAADHVAARRGELDVPAPREQRRREQDRRADARAQRRVERRRADGFRVDAQRVAAGPFRVRAGGPHEIDERLEIADARDVVEGDRLIGQQRGRDDRQRGVLVAARANGAAQPVTAFDDELHCGHVLLCRKEWVKLRDSCRRCDGGMRLRGPCRRRGPDSLAPHGAHA